MGTGLQTPSAAKTYSIPAAAYERRLQGGKRWFVLFLTYSAFMFIANLVGDLIFKAGSEGRIGSSNWIYRTLFQSLFFGAAMSLFALGDERLLAGLEIGNDYLVLYQGQAIDPLYRRGLVVPASEIRNVRQVSDFWLLKRSGVLVRYGRFRWFGWKRFFIPEKSPNYVEIRDKLLAFRTGVV